MEFCLVAAHIYVQAWISCWVVTDAPLNDLLLFRQIQLYSDINSVVSKAVMKKLQNHTWYLEAKMLPLSLFSRNVSVEKKTLIVEAMVHCGENWSSQDIKCSVSLFNHLAEKQLHDLVTSSSAAALHLFGISIADLSGHDPLTWDDIPSFRAARAAVESLKVVNDVTRSH